jgi:ABC-type multidrug transport system ATPase subunit
MKEISISNITYSIKDKIILDDINLYIDRGDSFALIGENGSGKSTLIDMLLRDLKPDIGHVNFIDNSVGSFEKVGVVYDSMPLFPMLKVSEIIKYFSVIHKLNYSVIKEQYFEKYGMTKIANTYVKKLSQGEKKKIGLLLSIIHNPSLLILDEPFANLDPTVIDIVWKTLKTKERTIFFTTHDWNIVENIASKVAFIYEGKIINTPSHPSEIISSLPAINKIIVDDELNTIKELKKYEQYKHDGSIHFFYEENSELLNIIKSHTNRYSIQNVDLKDAYLYQSKKELKQ